MEALEVALSYLVVLVVGESVLFLLYPARDDRWGLERLGLSFLLGIGAVSVFLFCGSWMAPGSLGPLWVLVPAAALICLRAVRSRWLVLPNSSANVGSPRPAFPGEVSPWSIVVCLLLGVETFGVGCASLVTGPSGDGLAVWALKSKTVFVSGGIPLSYLTDPALQWSHPAYPWLLPLAESWLYFMIGEVKEVVAMTLFPAFMAAMLLLLYGGLSRIHSKPVSLLLAALIGLIPALGQWARHGMADIVVAAYWAGSVLYMYLWLRDGQRRDLLLAIALAVLAAWTKREGSIFLVFQGMVLLGGPLWGKARGESVRALLLLGATSVVVLGPWAALLEAAQVRQNDFAPLSPETALAHADRMVVVVQQAAREARNTAQWGILWYLFGVALLIWVSSSRKGLEAYLALSVLLPLSILGLGYTHSLYDPVGEHVESSLGRLMMQQAPGAMLFVASQLHQPLARMERRLRTVGLALACRSGAGVQ